MNQEIQLLIAGGLIALATSICTAWSQHLLSLRTERIKREQEQKRREQVTRKMIVLVSGLGEHTITRFREVTGASLEDIAEGWPDEKIERMLTEFRTTERAKHSSEDSIEERLPRQ
jgi:hypothetical protein